MAWLNPYQDHADSKYAGFEDRYGTDATADRYGITNLYRAVTDTGGYGNGEYGGAGDGYGAGIGIAGYSSGETDSYGGGTVGISVENILEYGVDASPTGYEEFYVVI
jgi:hypothetical protein